MKEIFHMDESDLNIGKKLGFLYSLEEEGTEYTKQKGTDVLYEILQKPEQIKAWSVFSNEDGVFPGLMKEFDYRLSDYRRRPIDTEIEQSNFFKGFYPREELSEFFKLIYLIYRLYEEANINKDTSEERENIYEVMREIGVDIELKLLIDDIYSEIVGIKKVKNEHASNKTWDMFLKNLLTKMLEKEEWDALDSCYFIYALQLVIFARCIENPKTALQGILDDTVCIAAIYAANRCYQKDWNKDGIRLAKLGLNVEDPENRQDAYNLLGVCAIDDNQLQLAYDCYFSWINKKVILEVEQAQRLEKKLKSNKEEVWRVEKKKEVAIMYGNYAYVCGAMCDLLNYRDPYFEAMVLAEYYIKKAVEAGGENRTSTNYYCSAGTILSDAGEIEESITFYEKYKEYAEGVTNKLNASRSLIREYRSLLRQKEKGREHSSDIDKLKNKLNAEIDEFVKLYQRVDRVNHKSRTMNEELRYGRNIYTLMSKCHGISTDKEKVRYLLLQINRDVSDILKRLKRGSSTKHEFKLYIRRMSTEVQAIIATRKEELKNKISTENAERVRSGEIAYYTTLSNVQYLFDEVVKEEKDDKGEMIKTEKKNCFTMMHAKYMNDPEEGLILLQDIKDYLPSTPEQMRDELYDQKYVFMRSFTGLIDQLNMWTLYGSDKTSGKDCNGCCVCFAPETFETMISRSESDINESTQITSRSRDDYHLYSIAYLDGENIVVDGKKDTIIRECYEQLKNHLADLEKTTRHFLDTDKKIITSCLVVLFEKIMFLFKDYSYRLEEESRLIITRTAEDRAEINKTEQTPPKLYINPFYQIYPEKIILGPKVEDADFWMPHFQYELDGFKEKWKDNFSRGYKPIVRKSRINIR